MELGEETVEREGVSVDLLKRATAKPAGKRLEDYNPMENIPTISVGAEGEFEPGMTITGYYEGTEVLASPKFVHSKEVNDKGVPTQLRHILRIGSPTGERLGIWNCGELKVGFEKIQVGTLISLTYLKKGLNAKNQQQHFFKWQKEVVAPVANH